MSVLFADVFEAIRAIRVCKGTSEKDIMNFVQDKVGGCLSVKNVLKTIRTLNKLVEEGLLVKKGKRYMFPPNPPRGQENPCCEEDDESIVTDDEEKNSCNNESSVCNKCPEEDEEEEEEDDDECDDDCDDECDDEDEMKDEDCDEKDENLKSDSSHSNSFKETSCTKIKSGSNNKSVTGNTGTNNKTKGSSSNIRSNQKNRSGKNGGKELSRCLSGAESAVKSKVGRKGSKSKASNRKGGETMSKHSQGSVDSKCSSKGDSPIGGRFNERSQSSMFSDQKVDQFAKLFVAKNQGSKKLRNSISKRSRLTNSYRSRSPVRRADADMYHVFTLDKTGIMGSNPIQSQIFEEAIDTEMDVDVGVNTGDYNLRRRPSSVISTQPNTSKPDTKLLGENSGSCSNFEKKAICEPVKEKPALEGEAETKNDSESKASLFKPKNPQNKKNFKSSSERSKEKIKRDNSQSSDKVGEKGGDVSLCSVCEKKRKNS